MDENWYAAEQEVRDRLTEARAAARIRTLTRGLERTARPPHFIWAAVRRLMGWTRARATELPPARSGERGQAGNGTAHPAAGR
jgi:hypothetical protein